MRALKENMIMHEELKELLRQVENNYNAKEFRDVVNHIKEHRINDDLFLEQVERIRQERFEKRHSFTFNILFGNILWLIITLAAIVLVIRMNMDMVFYAGTLVLMTTLHPLSHYAAGRLLDIGFTHYYLDGPAKVEPTLKIDYFSYLKASGSKRAVMHVSGVIGTATAPLVVSGIAILMGAGEVAMNLFIFFMVLVVFELLTSTKTGDLMRAKREYGYR